MKKDTEAVGQYLEGVVPLEPTPDRHRQELRERILADIESGRVISGGRKAWRMAAIMAALVSVGALATTVGISIQRYYFEGQGKDGNYHFASEPQVITQSATRQPDGSTKGLSTATSTSVTIGDKHLSPAEIEQWRTDLEEIAALRQRGAGELVSVVDTVVNGNRLRGCQVKYLLADGRTRTMGEGESALDGGDSIAQKEKEYKEIDALRQQGRGEVDQVIEIEVAGGNQRTLIKRYVLADGRESTMGESDPNFHPTGKPPTVEQIQETWNQKKFNQGEFLGRTEVELYGKPFVVEQHRFVLSDGKTAILSIGEVDGPKTNLTDDDWAELRGLTSKGAGEILSGFEEEIRGVVFVFDRRRYALTDGTEVVQSIGKPRAAK